jgi:hypothetical protein
VLPRNTIQVTIEQWLSDRSVSSFCLVFVKQKKVKDTANEKWLTHFECVGINILNHQTKIFANATLVNQLEVFMNLLQQKNDHINDCHVFSKNNTVRTCDCCLEDIEPCKCKGNGHQWIGNQFFRLAEEEKK